MEATHLLDMKTLMGDTPPNLLVPLSKKHLSIFRRQPDNYSLFLTIAAILSILIDWISEFSNWILLFYGIIISGIFFQKNRIKEIYYVSEAGLVVPYFWLSQKMLKFNEIIETRIEKLISKDTGSEIEGLRIIIDNSGLKFNTTGIQDSSIILSTEFYESQDLHRFEEEIRKFKRQSSLTPNTRAQRLTDQVNNSWFGKWKLIVFNSIDSSLEFGFHLLLINITITRFFEISLAVFFAVLLVLYVLTVLILNIADRPSSIVGLRSHELGALIYNEADLVTTVRFMLMSQPVDVELLDCELLFEGTPVAQINDLRELHPKVIEFGNLTYCVAQFSGNQTKSIGANVKFKYITGHETYSLPVYWA